MQNLPDLEPLVRETSRGNKRSEEQLFGILYKFIHAVIRKRWRNALSDDEISDIQLDALEKLLGSFRDPEKAEKLLEQGRIFGFVHVVAENTALDYNRKRKRREKVFLSIDEISDGFDEGQNWERKVPMEAMTADLSDFILGGMETTRMLGQLDGKYKEVISERICGADYEDIAEKMGISAANARQIHKRGVGILRQNLIEKHKSLISLLPPSQSVTLKRLYTKEAIAPATGELVGATEDEALSAFYALLLNRGLILFLLSIGLEMTLLR